MRLKHTEKEHHGYKKVTARYSFLKPKAFLLKSVFDHFYNFLKDIFYRLSIFEDGNLYRLAIKIAYELNEYIAGRRKIDNGVLMRALEFDKTKTHKVTSTKQ